MELFVHCGGEVFFFPQSFTCVTHRLFLQEDMALYFIVPLIGPEKLTMSY